MSEDIYFVTCSKCDRKWDKIGEQGVCVEWFDECIVCKFTSSGGGSNDGSTEDLRLISEESKKRRVGQSV